MKRVFPSACLILLLASSIIPSLVYGQVAISLTADGSTNVDVGPVGDTATIDFFISQEIGGADLLLAAVPIFDFESGIITGTEIASAGLDDGSGLFAAGNLFFSEATFTPSNSVEINQEFTAAQALPSSPESWFSVDLDISGLAAGTYNIDLQPAASENFLSPQGLDVGIASGSSLSFTISNSVPEPGATAVLISMGVVFGLRRRRQQSV